MNHLLIAPFLRRACKRRPVRFRAAVETLDTRRLMAAGITATPIAITGTAGSPLIVVVSNDEGGITAPTIDEPVGTPIPLVSLLNSSMSTLSANGYSGTVNWGDGTATDNAVFGNFYGPAPTDNIPSSLLTVNGPEHTYASAGTYTITISVTDPTNSTPTVYRDTATIAPAPIAITGQLNSPTMSGLLPRYSIITTTTPNFSGTTEPGATVILSATSNSTNQSVVVGGAIANAAGAWNITTTPFVDGIYAITATVTDATGNTGSLALYNLIPFSLNPLTVDASVPTVTGFQVTNARTGAFQVTYSDPSGLDLLGADSTSNYTVTRPAPTVKKGQTLAVATLTQSYGPNSLTVTGTLSTVKPLLTRNGTYVFTIHAAGITSIAGTPLDGEYTGQFPTGNGTSGGDFQVKVTIKNGKVAGLSRVTSAKVTAKAVTAAQHHAASVRR